MTTTAEISHTPVEARCFRLRRSYLAVGVISGVFFSAVGVISTIGAYWNVDGSFPRPEIRALLVAIFWSSFTLLSIWVIIAYFRERLFLDAKSIIQHGIIHLKAIHTEDVIHIKWRCWPAGGSIVIRTPSAKVKIHLGNFTTKDRQAIIRFFQETLAKGVQENWSQFEDFDRKLAPPHWLNSRSGVLVTGSVLMVFAGDFAYCSIAGFGNQYLLVGVILALAAICYIWRNWTYRDHNSVGEPASKERPEC